MASIEYRGCTVVQLGSGNIMIEKDGEIVMTAKCTRRKNKQELQKIVNDYLTLCDMGVIEE